MSDSSSRFPERGEQIQGSAVPKQRTPGTPTEASVEERAEQRNAEFNAERDAERAEQRPVVATPPVATSKAVGADSTGRVFPPDAAEKLRDRWHGIQTDFIDDPRLAVEQAETLVEQVSTQLTAAITAQRTQLRGRWQSGGPGSAADDGGTATEVLRTVLQEYRRVLNRMLEL